MNVIRASLSATGIILVLGCANCGTKPASDTPAEAPVGPTVQIQIDGSDLDASSLEQVFIIPVERTLKRGKNIAHTWSYATETGAEIEATFESGVSEKAALASVSEAADRIATRGKGSLGTPRVALDADDEPLRLRLSGTDLDAMHTVGNQIATEVAALAGVSGATMSMAMVPDVEINIDSVAVKEHGLRIPALANQLSKPEIQDSTDIDAIMAVEITAPGGVSIPLGDLATVQLLKTPTRLDRIDGNRVAWIFVEAAAEDDALRLALKGITSPNPSIRITVEE